MAARKILTADLARLRNEEKRARRGDVEGIHDFRVAARRLRATLHLFQPVLPGAEVSRLRAGLAWVGRAVGGVRDLDVLALALAARARRLEAELRRALGPVRREIRKRRKTAHAHMVGVLDGARYAAVKQRLARLAEPAHRGPQRGPSMALATVAGELLAPVWEGVTRAGLHLGGAADDAAADASYHRLRVRAKRLRYALEPLRSIGGARVRRALADIERLQEASGELQDCATQRAWLRAYAESPVRAPVTLLAAGAVMQLLARRARRWRRRVERAWRRFDHRARRRKVLGSFAERARSRLAPKRAAIERARDRAIVPLGARGLATARSVPAGSPFVNGPRVAAAGAA